ncbi:hypothetical protein CY34DRAFT_614918 [Suillus luteus UH-Slu-Lm8-n1]|uniref:Peroxin-7 n=1 Tax=Suillus luteus UH-Slu-Lm8-n1 TaxID=930992 RepID=A0A0D0ASA0_9AGAM|nr:hypothetical protein CY34DRAFT_614918 [Suillus luteus UH-Slu-Lm8-n1]
MDCEWSVEHLWEVGTKKRVPVFLFKSHELVVWSVVFAPDSKTFASASWDKMMVFVSSAQNPKMSESRMLLPATTSSNNLTRTKIISHVSQWQQIRHQSYNKPISESFGELLEHANVVWGVAFPENNQLIATGCWDNLIRTWTVPQSKSEKKS